MLSHKNRFNLRNNGNCITVNNVPSAENGFMKTNDILKHFIRGKEVFFGFYRIDGRTLSKSEWIKYDKEIPAFFKESGEYRELVDRVTDHKGRIKEYCGYLTIARAQVNEQLYAILPGILQYYLETVFFVPKIEFDEFEGIFKKYMKEATIHYLSGGYTDMYFTYCDSESFSIHFDPEKYDAKTIYKTVKKAWEQNTAI